VRFRGVSWIAAERRKEKKRPASRATGKRIVAEKFCYAYGAGFDILAAEKKKGRSLQIDQPLKTGKRLASDTSAERFSQTSPCTATLTANQR
jgi:uncharacterized protein (DUF2384 family)